MSKGGLDGFSEWPNLSLNLTSLEHNFRKTLVKLGIKPSVRIVIGVSGGADSMALAALCASWSDDAEKKCVAVIVDHGLRVESGTEATLAQIELEKLNLKSKIVKIDKTKPTGNVQNWARNQRYQILLSEARALDGILMIAHHQDDQLETLYMRLEHDSGLVGLAGMKMQRNYQSVSIIRPLLKRKKAELRAYCKHENINIVEDPTNTDLKYDRVKARNHLNTDNKLSSQLLQASVYFDKIVRVFKEHCNAWSRENIKIELPIYASFKISEFNGLPELMRTHLFQQLLWQIGAGHYPASLNSIRIGVNKIEARVKFTLAGCVVCPKNERLEIHAERKRNINEAVRIVPGKPAVIDNRWLVKTNKVLYLHQMSDEFYRHVIRDENWHFFIKKWRYPARLCIPILQDLDGRVVQPHIDECYNEISFSETKQLEVSPRLVTLIPIRKMPFWNEYQSSSHD